MFQGLEVLFCFAVVRFCGIRWRSTILLPLSKTDKKKKRNDTWVVPYKPDKPQSLPQNRHPAERSKGGTLRHCFKLCVAPPSDGLEEPETSPQRATGLAARKNSLHPTIRLPFAVKFLEFLEIGLPAIQFSLHPKEGSKRGLGQRPKVFTPRDTLPGRAVRR